LDKEVHIMQLRFYSATVAVAADPPAGNKI
jgi:hypothetical protein